MNQLVLSLGLASWKPLVVALLLPPVPWLLLALLAAILLWRRRRAGWPLMVLALALTWGSATTVVAEHTMQWLLSPPEALPEEALADLRREAQRRDGRTVVVVLGGGRDLAPEYGGIDLSAISLERLRYGVWLARESGLPIGFSGGVGRGFGGPSEASLATAIAAGEFRHPLAWTEAQSRDTRENAERTVALLEPRGVRHVVLVTHQAHQPRALRHFERAAAAAGLALTLTPAPVGVRPWGMPWAAGDFVPGNDGWFKTRYAVREWLGLLAGA